MRPKKELLKEIGLDESYFVHEYFDTDKIIFVQVDKEKNLTEARMYNIGEYAKWKNKSGWFRPDFIQNGDVYREIKDKENLADTLK